MKFKKSYSHIRKKTIAEIVTFITEYQNKYPFKDMCKVLKIHRSTYYKRFHWAPSIRELDNQKLDKEIRTIYYESKKRYGAPKIQKSLALYGRNISLKRVQRHMASLGLCSIIIKK